MEQAQARLRTLYRYEGEFMKNVPQVWNSSSPNHVPRQDSLMRIEC